MASCLGCDSNGVIGTGCSIVTTPSSWELPSKAGWVPIEGSHEFSPVAVVPPKIVVSSFRCAYEVCLKATQSGFACANRCQVSSSCMIALVIGSFPISVWESNLHQLLQILLRLTYLFLNCFFFFFFHISTYLFWKKDSPMFFHHFLLKVLVGLLPFKTLL